MSTPVQESDTGRLKIGRGSDRILSLVVRMRQIVERGAPRDVTVLITGESGTGKELMADALVTRSSRATGPFLKFNCAARPGRGGAVRP